jgi:hypothetical protein
MATMDVPELGGERFGVERHFSKLHLKCCSEVNDYKHGGDEEW